MAGRSDDDQRGDVPLVAWRPLAWIAGGVAVVMAAFSGRYGYHRDELYFLVAGRHPAAGYDDQPPLVPLLARAMDTLFPGSLIGLRLPAVLAIAAIVLLAGLSARELGGDRAAQLLAAAVTGCMPVLIVGGHNLSTTILDIAFWTTACWLLARWIRTRDDRLLLAAGPVLGLALLTKSLIGLLAVGLLAGVLLAGPRDLLRRPKLWISGAVALAMWGPNLWWQATNNWPQLRMGEAIAEDLGLAGRIGVIPNQLVMLGPPVAVIAIVGLVRLWRNPAGRPFAVFAWAYVSILALTLVGGGKEYYPAGLYPILMASGAIATVEWWRRGIVARRRWAIAAVVAGAVSTTVIALPIYPVAWLSRTPQAMVNYDAAETVGWPELTETVASVYRTLPAREAADAVILTRNYGQAGAIARYGDRFDLPEAYSGHNNFWRWGPPPDSAGGTVIIIGPWEGTAVWDACGSLRLAARHDNGYELENEEQGVGIYVCAGLERPWSELWPALHRFS